MFESQSQWFDHELRVHRNHFECRVCNNDILITRPQLETHMKSLHPNEVTGSTLDTLLDASQIARIHATECPLRIEYGAKLQPKKIAFKRDVSLKQFQMHLGRRMEQLSLAALLEDDPDGMRIQSQRVIPRTNMMIQIP
jgi:hypothetical protein